MNRNVPDQKSPPLKKSRYASLFWFFIAIVVGILSLCFSFMSKRQTSYLLYYLDWRQWPRWYSVILWIVAIGSVLNIFVLCRKTRVFLWTMILIAVVCITCIFSDTFHPISYHLFHFFKSFFFLIIRPYLYAPVTDFFAEGTVSLRLFSLSIPLIVLWGLILLKHRCIKMSKTKIPSEREHDERM